jgi:hypothetical protein
MSTERQKLMEINAWRRKAWGLVLRAANGRRTIVQRHQAAADLVRMARRMRSELLVEMEGGDE